MGTTTCRMGNSIAQTSTRYLPPNPQQTSTPRTVILSEAKDLRLLFHTPIKSRDFSKGSRIEQSGHPVALIVNSEKVLLSGS